jgi:hypothetical protein
MALRFTFTNPGQNATVGVPANTFPASSTAFSFEFAVRRTVYTDGSPSGFFHAYELVGYVINFLTSHGITWHGDYANGSDPQVSTAALDDGAWHSIAVTLTGGESFRLYIDGTLQGSVALGPLA